VSLSFFPLLQQLHQETLNRATPSQWPGSASNYYSVRLQFSKQLEQQALKTQAARNGAILQRTHLIALGVHGFHLLLRFTFVRRSFWAYLLLSFPSLLVQFWFERVGRPTYIDGPNGKELKRAGEDLEAKGLTEWMWDVVYWSWGCIVLTTLVGDWAWWFFVSHFHTPPHLLSLLICIQGCGTPLLGLAGIHDLYRCSSGSYGRWRNARRRCLERRAEQASTKDGEERRPEDAIQIVCIQSTHIQTISSRERFRGCTSFRS
jgi:hypothetical protein